MGCDHFSDNQGHIGDQQKDQTAKTRQIVCRPQLRKFPRVPKFHAIASKITTHAVRQFLEFGQWKRNIYLIVFIPSVFSI